MNANGSIPVLPYSLIVGQERLRRALEIAYVAPDVRGVLVLSPGEGLYPNLPRDLTTALGGGLVPGSQQTIRSVNS